MIYFFYGTLRDPELLAAVLGRAVDTAPEYLDGYGAYVPVGAVCDEPALCRAVDRQVAGVRVSLSAGDEARLHWYVLGCRRDIAEIVLADGTRAQTMTMDMGGAHGEWSFDEWRMKWSAICHMAVPDFMSAMGRVDAHIAPIRYGMILAGAASKLRAQSQTEVATVRRNPSDDDINIISHNIGYERFFAITDYRVRHRLFSGEMSGPVDRAVFVSGDATVVLPYDPVRDRVLLVEQVRMGPMARGARNPWQLEAIAGRVDPGESPEDTARREAGEEAGLTLGELIAAPRYYPSSGAKSEYVYSFIAIADLPDTIAGTAGLIDEGEDIRSHLVGFDGLMHMIDTGEVENGPLVILALVLAARRDELRRTADHVN